MHLVERFFTLSALCISEHLVGAYEYDMVPWDKLSLLVFVCRKNIDTIALDCGELQKLTLPLFRRQISVSDYYAGVPKTTRTSNTQERLSCATWQND